jgi:uncharacterized protein
LSWAAWLPTTVASRGLPGWDLPPELSRPLGAFGPTLAALLVTAVHGGPRGVRALLARLAIWRVGLGWYAFALVWPAAHSLATTGVHVLLGGQSPDFAHPPVLWLYPVPPELFAAGPWPLLPFVFVQSLLLSSPMGEEPGWRGFALPRLQARLGPLGASLALGILWGLWHLPLTLTSGDPTAGTFSGWYLLGITGDAVLYTWLFNCTGGSLLLVMLLHAAMSTTGLFLGAAEDSAVIGVALTWLAALAVLLGARRCGSAWAWRPSRSGAG